MISKVYIYTIFSIYVALSAVTALNLLLNKCFTFVMNTSQVVLIWHVQAKFDDNRLNFTFGIKPELNEE